MNKSDGEKCQSDREAGLNNASKCLYLLSTGFASEPVIKHLNLSRCMKKAMPKARRNNKREERKMEMREINL